MVLSWHSIIAIRKNIKALSIIPLPTAIVIILVTAANIPPTACKNRQRVYVTCMNI
jgi:hypothetical protein